MSKDAAPPTEELSVEPLEAPAPILPRLTREVKVSYTLNLLPNYIAKLYLYLFGEYERKQLDAFIKALDAQGTPEEAGRIAFVKMTVDARLPILHALYQFGIQKNLFEDQALGDEAMAYLNEDAYPLPKDTVE